MRPVKRFNELNAENAKTTRVLYKNKDLVVFVPTTYEAWCKYSKNTEFCSNDKNSFENHNNLGNLYRIFFKSGDIVRLTWDFIADKITWGLGGKGNKYRVHVYFGDPFEATNTSENPFDIKMFKLIESLPIEAIKKIREFQANSDVSIDKRDRYDNRDEIRKENTTELINKITNSDLSIESIKYNKRHKDILDIIVKYNDEYVLAYYTIDKRIVDIEISDFGIVYNLYIDSNRIEAFFKEFIENKAEEFLKKEH